MGIPSSEYVQTNLLDVNKTGLPEGRQTPSKRKSVHDAVVTLAQYYQDLGVLPPPLVSVSVTVPNLPRNNGGRNGLPPHKWTHTKFVLRWATYLAGEPLSMLTAYDYPSAVHVSGTSLTPQ